jgi:hypothetical protein
MNFPDALLGFLRQALAQTPRLPPAGITQAEWAAFIEAARWHRLGPLLHVRLAPVAAALPARLTDALQAEYRQHALWGVALAAAAGQVLETLTAAGIEPAVLKGMAMGEVLYHNLALRPTADLDLLVPHADVSKVKAALLALGFEGQGLAAEERPHLAGEVALRASLLAGELRFGVDVHWRLAQHPAVMFHLAAEDWLPRSVPARIAGVRVRVLCPEDALLHAAIHLFWHHLGTWHLGWLSDVDLLLRTHGAAWNWTALAARAQALRALLPLQASLRLAHTWFNTPLPNGALAALAAVIPAPEEAAAFRDLDRQRHNSLGSVQGRVQALRSRPARLAYWRGILFPPATYMIPRYHIPWRGLLPFYYLGRIVKAVVWTSWQHDDRFQTEQPVPYARDGRHS